MFASKLSFSALYHHTLPPPVDHWKCETITAGMCAMLSLHLYCCIVKECSIVLILLLVKNSTRYL